MAETLLIQVTQGRGQPQAVHSSPGGLREPLFRAGGSQHGPSPQKQERVCEGDEMLLQIWPGRRDKSGPAANGAKRTVPGELDSPGTAGWTHIHHCRDFSHCSSPARVSLLVLEPEQTRTRSEWYKGEGNGKSFKLLRFCAIYIQAGLSLGPSALSTGHRERAWSFPPFLQAGIKMCQAGILPRAAPSWASLLLPVLGGRKYQANSSVHDFKTSTSSAGCKMRMEEPG